MKSYNFILLFVLVLFLSAQGSCQDKKSTMLSFYNMENLFDTINDPKTNDEDFLPDADYKWNTEKYTNKLHNMASVIAALNGTSGPEILGVCEIENKTVLNDLINEPVLKKNNYKIVHFDSKDERGIDVALLYNAKKIKLNKAISVTPDLSEWQDATRDLLMVQLTLSNNEKIWVIVCHAPSRREGEDISSPKRVSVAKRIRQFTDSLINVDPTQKIFVMGDFNDGPTDPSIKEIEKGNFTNAMLSFLNEGKGSLSYNNNWFIFDQILYYQGNEKLSIVDKNSAFIFSPSWLKQHGNPKYEGTPLRTFGGKKYLNGYSDHFPVGILVKNK